MDEQMLVVRGWSVPKFNETHNEDCWGVNEASGRIAVADGVAQASYSLEWAQALVRGFVEGHLAIPEDEISFEEQLKPLREQWWEMVPWERLARKGHPFDTKAKQGGFSTFLGVTIDDGSWSAFVIGDCNLFVVSYNGQYKESWPAVNEADFGNMPLSIRSVRFSHPNHPHSDRNIFRSIRRKESPVYSGDCIVICTDALSAFLLAHRNQSALWWDMLSFSDSSPEEFSRWINRLRGEGLKNDDTTAVVIEIIHVS